MDDPNAGTTDLTTAVAAAVAATPTASAPGKDLGTLIGLGPSRSFSDTQRLIALLLLLIMIGIITTITVVSLVYTSDCSHAQTCTQASSALDLLNKSMSPIFTAMIGLVGSVVGFYFGSKQTS